MNTTIDERTTFGGEECKIDFSEWKQFDRPVYVCRAAIFAEPEGGFSVHATRLPGVVSQGETIEEAVENIQEAFKAVLQSYLDLGMEIPWKVVPLDQQPVAMRNLTIEL